MSAPLAQDTPTSTSGRPPQAASGRRSVVLMTTDFPPRVGGIAEYHAGLWREVATWGAGTVYATVPGAETHGADARQLPAPPERKLGTRPGDGIGVVRRANTLAHFAALRRYARRVIATVLPQLDRDARICIGLWNPVAHFWCEALAAAGRPYALFAHGLDVIEPLYPTVAPWRAADFRSAARVIANSTGTATLAAELLQLDPRRIRVVNPGIEVASYVPPSSDAVAALRAALRLRPGDLVLLSVGRLVRRKGFDVALRAFAAHRRGGGRGTYLIAGDGPERAALEALARELGVADDVRFMGAVDEATKVALYEVGDVFVMPNSVLGNRDWEGFGIVFIEAARAGMPSVGGANGGVADAVVDGVTGLLVDPADQGAVDRAVHELLTDDARRARLGAAARRRAQEELDWRVIGERFRAVLEEAW